MTGLQKRIAASILKVGKSRVWFDPDHAKDIDSAITKADIRKMIQKKWVKDKPLKIRKPREKGRNKRGQGSRKGGKHSIVSKKRHWISTVRPLRAMLKELRATKQIDNITYRRINSLVKGGMFRNSSHLRIYLEQHGIIKKK